MQVRFLPGLQFPKLLMQVPCLNDFGQARIPAGTTEMFYAYVIRSLQFPFVYKGHCENLEKRLLEHNNGQTKSISAYTPFEIIYYEEFQSRADAIKREKYFKTAAGRRFLKSKLGNLIP